MERARSIVKTYRIVIHSEDGEYVGRALELPGAMNDGKCLERTIDMLTTAVAIILEEGGVPPLPASDERRDEQVTIRLSRLEKLTFEEAARSRIPRPVRLHA